MLLQKSAIWRAIPTVISTILSLVNPKKKLDTTVDTEFTEESMESYPTLDAANEDGDEPDLEGRVLIF